MNKNTLSSIYKTIIIAVSTILLSTVIHMLLELIIPFENSITGKPNISYLIPIYFVQIILIVLAYNLLKDYLPFSKNWKKGLGFAVLFLLAVQIPSVFGIIAYEPNSAWQFFTQTKIANYITLFGDILTFVFVGVLLGRFFPAKESNYDKAYKVGFASFVGAIVFPLALLAIMRIFYSFVHVNDAYAPMEDSLWFNIIFYGIFFMTGFCLPILHKVIKANISGSRIQKIFYTTGIFCLLWLPVQNFMVVFGWGFAGGFVFSLLSIIPIFLTVFITDIFIINDQSKE